MLRVLFFSHYPTTNGLDGGNKILLVTALGLPSDKYEKIVITPGKGVLSEYFNKAGIAEKSFDYDCGHFNGMLYAAGNKDDFEGICKRMEEALVKTPMYQFIREWKPDIVYANTVMAINGAIMGKLAGAKVIWHIHDIITNYLNPVDQNNISKVILRYSDKVIYVAKAVGESMPMVSSASKSELLYIGVEGGFTSKQALWEKRTKLRNKLGVNQSQPVAAFLGQIVPIKGVEHFIKAASYILKLAPESLFIIIGNPKRDRAYTSYLNRLIRRLGIGSNIKFTGYAKDLNEIMPAIDCLVIPSRFEDPLPAVIIEAGLYYKPSIAYNRGGISDAIKHGYNGFLIEPDNVKHLAAAMYKLMSEPKAAFILGEHGYNRAVLKFGFPQYIRNMETILDEVSRGQNSVRTGREGQLLKARDGFWYVYGGCRYFIRDSIMKAIGLHKDDAINIDSKTLNLIPEGSGVESIYDILYLVKGG